jgi:hypothetical protein
MALALVFPHGYPPCVAPYLSYFSQNTGGHSCYASVRLLPHPLESGPLWRSGGLPLLTPPGWGATPSSGAADTLATSKVFMALGDLSLPAPTPACH